MNQKAGVTGRNQQKKGSTLAERQHEVIAKPFQKICQIMAKTIPFYREKYLTIPIVAIVFMLNQRYCPDSSLISVKSSVFFISFPQAPGARKICPHPFTLELRLCNNLPVYFGNKSYYRNGCRISRGMRSFHVAVGQDASLYYASQKKALPHCPTHQHTLLLTFIQNHDVLIYWKPLCSTKQHPGHVQLDYTISKKCFEKKYPHMSA